MKLRANTLLVAALLVSISISAPAVAQNVIQGGAVTPGHAAAWRANGVLGDAGGSAAPTKANQGAIFGGLNVLGGICSEEGYNDLTLSPVGYHQLCLFANSLGGGLISYNAYNGAAALPLQAVINGTTYPFPFTVGGITGPVPSVVGDLPSWQNISGNLLNDSGVPYSAVPHNAIIGYPATTWTSSPTATNAFVWLSPPGYAAVNQTGTQCQGFPEAMAAAATSGLSVYIYGPGENTLGGGGGSSTYPFIACAAATDTGAMAQRSIIATGINITYASTVTGCAFKINTMLDGASFRWDGLIVDGLNAPTNNSHAVCVAPTSNAPVEAFVSTLNTPIFIGGIAFGTGSSPNTAAGSDLFLDPALGSIRGMDITVGEINCNGPGAGAIANTGIQIGPSTVGGTGVFANRITVFGLHQCINGIVDGAVSAVAGPKFNTFTVYYLSPNTDMAGNAGIAFDEFGHSNQINLLSVNTGEGAYNTAIKFELGSGATAGAGAVGDIAVVNASGYSVGVGWVDATNGGLGGADLTFNGTKVLGANLIAWTPALQFGGASTGITYATQTGTYRQSGKLIVADFNILLTSKGSATGATTIGGLPVAGNGAFAGDCELSVYSSLSSLSGLRPWGKIVASSSAVTLQYAGATGNADVADTNFGASSALSGTCSYLTN